MQGQIVTIEKRVSKVLGLAAKKLRDGELVVYPTDTLYGLGASIFNEQAIKRVFELKLRPKTEPISIAVADIKMMQTVAHMTKLGMLIYRRYLPGPLTLVLNARATVSPLLTGGTGLIGVRVPNYKFTLQLLSKTGPVTATSANVHGGKAPSTIKEAYAYLGSKVSLYLDGGRCSGVPSTVVDASGYQLKLIREGAIPFEDLKTYVGTGNSSALSQSGSARC